MAPQEKRAEVPAADGWDEIQAEAWKIRKSCREKLGGKAFGAEEAPGERPGIKNNLESDQFTGGREWWGEMRGLYSEGSGELWEAFAQGSCSLIHFTNIY